MIAMFKLFYNTIAAACQRPVGPLLSYKSMYLSMYYYCIKLVKEKK